VVLRLINTKFTILKLGIASKIYSGTLLSSQVLYIIKIKPNFTRVGLLFSANSGLFKNTLIILLLLCFIEI
jgi:hypothetical protein